MCSHLLVWPWPWIQKNRWLALHIINLTRMSLVRLSDDWWRINSATTQHTDLFTLLKMLDLGIGERFVFTWRNNYTSFFSHVPRIHIEKENYIHYYFLHRYFKCWVKGVDKHWDIPNFKCQFQIYDYRRKMHSKKAKENYKNPQKYVYSDLILTSSMPAAHFRSNNKPVFRNNPGFTLCSSTLYCTGIWIALVCWCMWKAASACSGFMFVIRTG